MTPGDENDTLPAWYVEVKKGYHVRAATADKARERVVCGYGGIKLESELVVVEPLTKGEKAGR